MSFTQEVSLGVLSKDFWSSSSISAGIPSKDFSFWSFRRKFREGVLPEVSYPSGDLDGQVISSTSP